MSYDYATERPKLFSEQGLDVVQAVTRNAVRHCQQAGAVRAGKAWKNAPGSDSWQLLAALDYLVETRVLSEVTDGDAAGQHRVFVLNPAGPYGDVR